MDKKWALEILGDVGYTAFHQQIDAMLGEGYFGREKSRKWDEASDETRKGWMAAVKAILDAYPTIEKKIIEEEENGE